jgi:hypothetical protein
MLIQSPTLGFCCFQGLDSFCSSGCRSPALLLLLLPLRCPAQQLLRAASSGSSLPSSDSSMICRAAEGSWEVFSCEAAKFDAPGAEFDLQRRQLVHMLCGRRSNACAVFPT